jgi:hypothetical protein
VFILILALCWIAFGMAPTSASKFMFAGREAALLVGPIVVGLTIAAAATMPLINMALDRVDIDFAPLEPGPLLYSVLLPTAAVIGLVAAVEGWQVTAGKGDRSNGEANADDGVNGANHADATERSATKVANLKFAMEAGIMCVAGAIGLVLGAPHIVDTVLTAARGH